MRATRSGRRPRSGSGVAAFFSRFQRDVQLSAPRAGARRRRARLEFSRFASAEGVDAPRRVAYRLNENQEIELWLWPGLDVGARRAARALPRAVRGGASSSCNTSTRRSRGSTPGPARSATRRCRWRCGCASCSPRARNWCACSRCSHESRANTGQRGVAVVLAMGVVALAAIAAAAMLASQSTWSRHAELSAEHVQAQALVRAGVDWARAAAERRSPREQRRPPGRALGAARCRRCRWTTASSPARSTTSRARSI